VREEMRQVAWPSRPELINYTTIVLFVLIFMTALIFGLGFGFSKFVTFLFTKVRHVMSDIEITETQHDD
jgi:preprotein translocase subunit SecE